MRTAYQPQREHIWSDNAGPGLGKSKAKWGNEQPLPPEGQQNEQIGETLSLSRLPCSSHSRLATFLVFPF
jgi:hypothetical protein